MSKIKLVYDETVGLSLRMMCSRLINIGVKSVKDLLDRRPTVLRLRFFFFKFKKFFDFFESLIKYFIFSR